MPHKSMQAPANRLKALIYVRSEPWRPRKFIVEREVHLVGCSRVAVLNAKGKVCYIVLKTPLRPYRFVACVTTWALITVKPHLLCIVTLSYLLLDIDSIHLSHYATPSSSVQIPPLSSTSHHLFYSSTPISHQPASMPHCHCHCH